MRTAVSPISLGSTGSSSPAVDSDWLGLNTAANLATVGGQAGAEVSAGAAGGAGGGGAGGGPVGGSGPPVAGSGANTGSTGPATVGATGITSITGPGEFQQDLQFFGFSAADAAALEKWYTEEITGSASKPAVTDPTQILDDFYQTPQFQAQFPAIGEMQKAGIPPVDPGTYVNYIQQANQYAKAAGLPPGMLTKADIDGLIANQVSLGELSDRLNKGLVAAQQAPPQTTALLDQWYGIKPGSGALAAYYLDPDKATPLLLNQTQAAVAGGLAEQEGFKNVGQGTMEEAARLANAGSGGLVSTSAIQGAEGSISSTEKTAEGAPTVTSDQALGAALIGDRADINATAAAVGYREAPFKGGGGFAGQGTPSQTGIGSASQ